MTIFRECHLPQEILRKIGYHIESRRSFYGKLCEPGHSAGSWIPWRQLSGQRRLVASEVTVRRTVTSRDINPARQPTPHVIRMSYYIIFINTVWPWPQAGFCSAFVTRRELLYHRILALALFTASMNWAKRCRDINGIAHTNHGPFLKELRILKDKYKPLGHPPSQKKNIFQSYTPPLPIVRIMLIISISGYWGLIRSHYYRVQRPSFFCNQQTLDHFSPRDG